MLEVHYVSPVSYHPDEEAWVIKKKIKENSVKRLLFDGIENLETALPNSIERKNYMAVLLDLFSSMGVTTVITSEISEHFGGVRLTHETLSNVVDNIILLKHVEIEGNMKGFLSIMKSRGIKHDTEIREFDITEKGIVVKGSMKGYESVLSGIARKISGEFWKNRINCNYGKDHFQDQRWSNYHRKLFQTPKKAGACISFTSYDACD